jgi:hypothetical protein
MAIKRKIIETTKEYNEQGKLIREITTETTEDDTTEYIPYYPYYPRTIQPTWIGEPNTVFE